MCTYLSETAIVDNRIRIPVTIRNIGCLDPWSALRLCPIMAAQSEEAFKMGG
jgi:hypothetical protein